MTTADALVEAISEESIPKSRKPHILNALKQAELMENGELPKKSARELLRELREMREG